MKKDILKEDAIDIIEIYLAKIDIVHQIYLTLIKFAFSVGLPLLMTFLFKLNGFQGLQVWEKIFASSPIFILLLAAGNLLNNIWSIREIRMTLFNQKTNILLGGNDKVDVSYLQALDAQTVLKLEENEQYYKYANNSIMLSILIIAISFYWLIFSRT